MNKYKTEMDIRIIEGPSQVSDFEIGHTIFEELTEQELEDLYKRDVDLKKWKEQTAKWFAGFMKQWYEEHGFEITEKETREIIRVIRRIKKKPQD